MRLRTNARVTASGPKRSKMQELIEKTWTTLCKELKGHNGSIQHKNSINNFQKTTTR